MRSAELLDPDPQDLAVMRGYPSIPWLEPLAVRSLENPTVRGYACRVCIARYGLSARDIRQLHTSKVAVREHLVAFHHLDPDGIIPVPPDGPADDARAGDRGHGRPKA